MMTCLMGVFELGIAPCYFHVSISIGTPESDLLSLSTPRRTKWTLVYFINALQHKC